jgi:hypothetical protein
MGFDLQKHFNKFHETIKLDDNDTLKEKRETLTKELKTKLAKDDDAPTFTYFNQGSYAMFTGTTPPDGDYDIDVGLVFDCDKEDYDDPVDLKILVRDALKDKNRTVVIRRPCVTVKYLEKEKTKYHVDLAVYAKNDGNYTIAKGMECSAEDKRFWERSEPKGLIAYVNDTDRHDDDGRAQLRRVIRYMKRWREHKLKNDRPYSIALTVAACRWFAPYNDSLTGKMDDLMGLYYFVQNILSRFNILGKLEIILPVEPFNNLNADMTDNQMSNFKERLEELFDALRDASNSEVEDEACEILKKQFGPDFPVPPKEENAKKVPAGYAPAGTSAA